MDKEIRKIITKRNGTRSVITTLYGTKNKKSVKLATGRATCCKSDVFDFNEGAELSKNRAIAKYEDILEGDYVEVINPARTYSRYTDWVLHNIPDKAVMYVYGHKPVMGSEYKVIKIAQHRKYDKTIYAIESTDGYGVYLIDKAGIKKYANTEMCTC